jgi:PAS domain S-box-containing protein
VKRLRATTIQDWAIRDPWFAGALGLAVLIVIFDVGTGDSIVLIALLAVPPLMAALRCSAYVTGLVGSVCVLLAVLMGMPEDIYGEREHVIDVTAVLAVGAAAVYVAHVRQRLLVAQRRTQMLARAGRVLQRSLDYENSLTELARSVVPELCDWCSVVVGTGDGRIRLVTVVHHDPDREALAREVSRRWPLDPAATGGAAQVIRTGEPEFYPRLTDESLARMARDPEHLEALRQLGLGSTLVLPLSTRGLTLGAIVFTSDKEPIGKVERALAEEVAERAAVTLDNATLYSRTIAAESDLRASRDQLEAILDGVADGVTAQDISGKMIYANEEALKMLGFPSVKAIQAVPIRYVLSRFEVWDEDGRPFPPDQLPGRQALMGEQPDPVLVRMRRRDTGDERWSIVKATPIKDGDGNVILAINVYENVTEHIQRQRTERVLARAGELVATSLDYERTLERIAEIAAPEIADWCAVDVVVDGEIRRVAFAGPDEEGVRLAYAARRRIRLDPSGTAGIPQVLRSGASELYPQLDVESDMFSDEQRELLKKFGIRSAMYVPLVAHGRTLGVMTLMGGEASGRVFDENDLTLAQELAGRCAVAVDNARLFRERSRIARTLQESLLPPSLPEVPGIDVGARFHAAGAGYEVGGDFYDVFDVGGGSFGVVIGDVCGKGPDAAAVTALARYTVRATATHERSPARVLGALNEALLAQVGEDKRFCTVAYMRIDQVPNGARATVATGGHPLPLVLRAHGESGEAGRPGTVLGIVPDPDLVDVEIDLQAGDAVVLYTDGVTEARAPARVYGANDLTGFAGQHKGLKAAAIAERIERGALSAQAEEPRDDVAIVVLKVRSGADPVAGAPSAMLGMPA